MRCVAAPIRDATGAISVSATRPYMPAARMRGLNHIVGRAARQVSAGLGHREP
ncbi:hypothetical protein [Amycolatopsis sp. cmx-4-54]|uniref:hypothetical protein n=1 Tax=Amycolatopsis sp. cmx-4-54 TaxID=2790936 RepID=UPI003977F725